MTTTDARKRNTENAPRIYPGDVIDVDGRIIRIPKENPMTKHPETTTEWLEDIALELHAITGLLNERLPKPTTVHHEVAADNLDTFKHEASKCCDAPDEALARVLYDTECGSEGVTWGTAGAIAKDTYRDLARAAREHVEAGRPPETDWEGLFGVEQRKREKAEAELETVKTTLRDVEARRDEVLAQRDEWKAKFEQAAQLDGILARDERDFQTKRADDLGVKLQASDAALAEESKWAEVAARWEGRHAALRADVEVLSKEWDERFMALPDATKRHAAVLNDCTSELEEALDRDDERSERDA